MAEDEQYKYKRAVPQSDLDFSMLTTDSVWGKFDVPPELRNRLDNLYLKTDEQGNKTVTKESLWGLLGFYTRDMRLANLSTWANDYEVCQYHLDLANDFLQADMIKPFLITLSRVATILELSQSKGGFLRRRMGTFTQEHRYREEEPPKKNLFGVGKSRQGGGY